MCVCVCALFYSSLFMVFDCFLKKEKSRSWVDGEVEGQGGAREMKA